MPDADAQSAGQARHHHRRAQPRRHAPGAARLGAAQRRAVRLLPDRADHAGGGDAAEDAQPDRRRHRFASWPATSAAAARTSGSVRPSRPRRMEAGREPRRKRQPPPVPARGSHRGRVRARRESAALVSARPPASGVPDARGVVAAESERLSRHPSGRHGLHRHASFRDGHRHPDDAAAGGSRRARRRLEPRDDRAGHRRRALRRSEHRRLAIDPRLLRGVPARRRRGEGDAGDGGRGAVGRVERRVHHAEPPGRAPADRPHARLRRARAGRRQAGGAERRIAALQGSRGVEVRGPGHLHLRPEGHRHGQRAVRARRVP